MLETIKKFVGNRSSLIGGTLVIGIGIIICKVIGAVYRIPLTNILGAEGMGLYQMIYPVFALLLVVSSSGIPVAISRLIADNIAKGNTAVVRKIEVISLILMFCVGLVLSLALFLLSNSVADLQGNIDASKGYALIAPSVLFVCLISAQRGVFQGRCDMLPTATSQIIEQIGKLILGLSFAIWWLPNGIEYGVAGAMLGISLSEVLAMIFLFIIKWTKQSKSRIAKDNLVGEQLSNGQVLKKIIGVTLPITLCSAIVPIGLVIDSVLVVNLLLSGGVDIVRATSEYGIYSGVVNSLVNLPIIISSSFALVLVPSITANFSVGESGKISDKIRTSLILTTIVSLPCALVYIFFGEWILSILFPSIMSGGFAELSNTLLVIGSLGVLSISLFNITTAILQATKRLWFPSIVLLLCIIAKTIFVIVFINQIGIVAVSIANIISFTIAFLFNMSACSTLFETKKLPILQCVIPNLVMLGMMSMVNISFQGLSGFIIAIVVGGVYYIMGIFHYFSKYNFETASTF